MIYTTITDENGYKMRIAVSAKVQHIIEMYNEIEDAHTMELHGSWRVRLDGLPPDRLPLELQAASAEDTFFDRLCQEIREQNVNNIKIFQEQKEDAILHILSNCTPLQKERFLLYTSGKMTFREIAKKQKCSYVAVRNSVQKVLKKLQNNL